MKKQAVDGEGSMDRISQLPLPMLQHILCFLSQKDAIRTCVLSKSWLQIGSTRPKIEFLKSDFPDDETFLSVCQTTLQRYQHQKLSIYELRLEMPGVDSESISFLEKWIPIVILNMGVNTFDLSFFSSLEKTYFDMPFAVFESKDLQKLCLHKCKFSLINPLYNVILFKRLNTLSLKEVYVGDKALDMILSWCHLLEVLVLDSCEGLRNVKLNKSHNNLKLFDFREPLWLQFEDDYRSIEIDAPTLENIKINFCPNWLNLHRYLFPHLKSLYLHEVRLSSKTFDIFSCIFPCLVVLSLTDCYGFEEFHLSSRSIKNLIIGYIHKPAKAVIDAPSLVRFEYEGDVSLSISFKATASEWKSRIVVSSNVILNDFDPTPWCLDLNEMLKAFSKSQISLDIFQDLFDNEEEEEDPYLVPEDTFGGLFEPVVVELLHLRLYGHSQYLSSVLIINLLHICRPRNIHQFWYFDAKDECERCHNQVTKFLRNALLWEREMRRYSWQKDLEQADMEEVCDDEDRVEVRFQLKWRGTVEINAPTLEEIKICSCPNWLNLDRYLFPHLKYLYLDEVRLPSKTLDIFSCIFPCLEVLSLADCYGFEELHISSHSIKNLIIGYTRNPPKAVIDAPILVGFEYEGDLNVSFSFKATASVWKSTISLNCIETDFSSWCLELYEMMKAFSKSQISLDIYLHLTGFADDQEEDYLHLLQADTFGGLSEAFAVELLHLSLYGHTQYYSWVFIIYLLHICRPSNILQLWFRIFDTGTEVDYKIQNQVQVTMVLKDILLWEREMRHFTWQKDLEQVDLEEVYDNEHVHLKLKWR